MELSNSDIKNLACMISELLNANGIDAVLVGGACVSIYTQNQYQSYDLDFVSYQDLKHIEKVLKKIGFQRVGRCFTHDQCLFLIDFVNPPIAIGNESIRQFETITTPSGVLRLLTPTDCVKDRLSSFFHWNDEQSLEQALSVTRDHVIDLKNVEKWAKTEDQHDKFKIFLSKLK